MGQIVPAYWNVGVDLQWKVRGILAQITPWSVPCLKSFRGRSSRKHAGQRRNAKLSLTHILGLYIKPRNNVPGL
nr:MAG TPA: hypothetical protein [Caudoviricetes sp.]